MKKTIRFDKRADKEIKQFSLIIQAKIKAIIQILARDGNIIEPFGKKIDKNLFEIRIKHQGQWRVIYAYLVNNCIIILSAFQKKTQKTPTKELEKAKKQIERILMNKRLRKILKQQTISLAEFSQDFTAQQEKTVTNEIRYYDVLIELKKLRKQLGLTQEQLATKAALPRTTITKIESGTYNPTLNTLVTIASAMNKKLQVQFL